MKPDPRARIARADQARTLGRWLAPPALLVTGAALVLHFGRLGYMPLDQSIVFDGAWRLLSGQVPYRDFSTPSGLAPIALQAALFAVLGTTWFAYVLHAAIVNGLFCVLVYVLLRQLAAPRVLAFVYGLASGVLLYPPIGTPYLEQHAFFFVLLGVVLLLEAAGTASAARGDACAALVPPALALAFLSKQNVALFGAVTLLAVLLVGPRDLARGQRVVLVLAASAIATAGGLAALGLALGVDGATVAQSLLWLPVETGSARQVRVDRIVRSVAFLTSSAVVVVVAGAALPVVGALRWGTRKGRASEALRGATVALALACSLLAACLLFIATTKNQPANGSPYVFAALGCLHQGLRLALPVTRRLLAEVALAAVAIVLMALDVRTFHTRVNAPRLVNDLVFQPMFAAAPATPELSFLRLQTPRRSGITARHLDRLIEFLRAHDGNFFLLGDSSILYALTRRPSASPVLWFHPGLTFPAPGTPGFGAWNDAVQRSLEVNDVRYLVLEGEETWMRLRLADVPALERAMRERADRSVRFGPFTVVTLRDASR